MSAGVVLPSLPGCGLAQAQSVWRAWPMLDRPNMVVLLTTATPGRLYSVQLRVVWELPWGSFTVGQLLQKAAELCGSGSDG